MIFLFPRCSLEGHHFSHQQEDGGLASDFLGDLEIDTLTGGAFLKPYLDVPGR